MTKRQTGISLLVIVITGVISYLLLWGIVLASAQPLNNPLAKNVSWLVACSTRGCITTSQWQEQLKIRSTFNKALEVPPPTQEETLTTLIRQHLVDHASILSSVTPADARRYREEILNAKEESTIQNATSLNLAQYDQLVLLPFLRQEAIREQRHIETTKELFSQLSKERYIIVLPWRLQWDREQGKVISK